jgi:formate dehydrogenase maturation protein FdhE
MGRMLGPREKEGLQAALEPLVDVTETQPNEDLLKKIEELDFDKMDTTSKENLIKALLNKGLNIQSNEKKENSETEKKPETNNSLTYSAPTPNI